MFNRLKKFLSEPLVHFLAIGALFFLTFHLWGGANPSANNIVITPGQIDSMKARFERTWQRLPTEEELKGLKDDHIRGEIAAREARALGLDRDDMIIKRRLRQKLEFMVEDAFEAQAPTETELQIWLNEHPDDFRTEPEIGFYQVYLNPEKRGDSIQSDAKTLIEELGGSGPPSDNLVAGDILMAPGKVGLQPLSRISGIFGKQFAEEIIQVEPGRWSGPVHSGYGLHLVYVTARKESRLPTLAEVRQAVEREYLFQKRKRKLDEMYERLLERYRVTEQKPADQSGTANAAVIKDRT